MRSLFFIKISQKHHIGSGNRNHCGIQQVNTNLSDWNRETQIDVFVILMEILSKYLVTIIKKFQEKKRLYLVYSVIKNEQ